MPLDNPTHPVLTAKRLVESDKRSEIRLNANGGNSILIVCDPMKEPEYIDAINDFLPVENFTIIDINQCLIDFVSNHINELEELYDALQSATHEIFKAPENEESGDLYKEIISKIHGALQSNHVPVLINSGALYGTGIQNIHLMENDIVMNGKLPLLVLYPATIDAERIMFLGKQSSSKYRCMFIQ